MERVGRQKTFNYNRSKTSRKDLANEEFGKNYYEKCAYINFEDNNRMQQLFSEGFNIDRIIHGLKMEARTNIEPGKTLIIFDEIQENPKALNALKYFMSNQMNII